MHNKSVLSLRGVVCAGICASLLGCGAADTDKVADPWSDDSWIGGGSAADSGSGDEFEAPPSEDIIRPSANPSEGEGERSAGVGIAPPGAQDFAEFRGALDDGRIPNLSSLDATGFINEHKIELPAADCGDLICLHGMLGVMANMMRRS